MCNISIGKNEVLKLRKREQEVLTELKNDASYVQKQGNTVFNFKTLKLQRELKQLQTKLKLLAFDSDDVS